MIPIANDQASRRYPLVTRLLILVNLAVFAYQLYLGSEAGTAFLLEWALVPGEAAIWRQGWDWHPLGQVAIRCFTSMFLHGGWLHILGNLWTLHIFGNEIEERLGHWRYLWFYLFSGLLAAVLHLALNLGSDIPTVGASGAIAGVMGAYFLLFPFRWITFVIPIFIIPIPIKLPALVYLGFWLYAQFAGAYQSLGRTGSGGIAFWAHVGGFLAGMYLIRRWNITAPRKGKTKKR
jgi:membrane associated rhomboid family serine protease